jgi:hypothetical protein
MYVGRDFDPSDIGESERYSFDFLNDLQAGDSIQMATWSCAVAATSAASDANAAACIAEPAVYTGTKTTQRVTNLLPGVVYVLTATVVSASGDRVSLWSHVECKAPA